MSGGGKPDQQEKMVQGSRMPAVTLSLPTAIGLLALFLTIGAVLVYFALQQTTSPAPEATPTATETLTPTVTLTLTSPPPTITPTPEPSPTPLVYTVQLNDSCGGVAFAFGVSIQSIVLLNNLPADCSTLFEGQKLLIPHPTPTPTALPTATFSPAEATDAACPKLDYTVQESDTLSSIALNYAVTVESIREYNGLVNDVVRFGQILEIPLCERVGGPTPTPTIPPPYPAPNLLLPPDGAPFSLADGLISLQWASVGALREGEAYAVTIEDVTEAQGRKLVDYVTDTKFPVPAEFLPNDGIPHVIRWWVLPVRQVGTDDDGNPVWDSAGAVSPTRVFTWLSSAPQVTPTPP